MNKKLIDFVIELEKIIKLESPLRDPSITIVHCPVKNIKEIYTSFIRAMNEFEIRYNNWEWAPLNMEQELFKVLTEFEYTGGDNYVRSCSRADLKRDLRASVLTEMINNVEQKVDDLLSQKKTTDSPPFLLILNMHACYNYIQTKDIISRIISKKGILILILYLDQGLSRLNPDEDESYKLANYNVHSEHIQVN